MLSIMELDMMFLKEFGNSQFIKMKKGELHFNVNGKEVIVYEEKFENELEAFNYLKEQVISEVEKEVVSLEKAAIELFEQNAEYFFQESADVYFEMVEMFNSYILKKGEIKK